MFTLVPGGDQAALRAAHDRAGDVEQRPETGLAGNDELFGDLRLPAPLLEAPSTNLKSPSPTTFTSLGIATSPMTR
jgi:hypothetical protein